MRLQEGLKARLIAVQVAAVVVAVDLITKRLAALTFVQEPKTVIPGVLSFTYGENSGAAFSMFQNAGPLLAAAAVVAVGVVLTALGRPRPTLEVVAFGMVMGGAVGNLVDRIARAENFLDGPVIDWIQFPNFPIFNVADSAITVAVAVLFIVAWRTSDRETEEV